MQVGVAVDPAAGEGAARLRQQADGFVVADHLRAGAGQRRRFADVVQALAAGFGQFGAEGVLGHGVILKRGGRYCVRAITRAIHALNADARIDIDHGAGTVVVTGDLAAEGYAVTATAPA
jgi:hypothetical protein